MLHDLEKKKPDLRKKLLKPFLVDIDPNYVSLLAFFVAGASGFFFYRDYILLAGLLYFFNGFLDILDGQIAKEYDRTTEFGDFLDHTLDRLADFAVYFGVALNPAVPLWLGSLTVISILLVSYLGTQYQAITQERLYGGLLGRSDRIILLLFFSLGTVFFSQSLYYGIWIIFGLSIFTFFQRLYYSVKGVRKLD
ncbi:MAG: CDP-alcohol phosphatidyltransferase family protein [Candidatus Aenigmatarchaeota archaeon]